MVVGKPVKVASGSRTTSRSRGSSKLAVGWLESELGFELNSDVDVDTWDNRHPAD